MRKEWKNVEDISCFGCEHFGKVTYLKEHGEATGEAITECKSEFCQEDEPEDYQEDLPEDLPEDRIDVPCGYRLPFKK